MGAAWWLALILPLIFIGGGDASERHENSIVPPLDLTEEFHSTVKDLEMNLEVSGKNISPTKENHYYSQFLLLI